MVIIHTTALGGVLLQRIRQRMSRYLSPRTAKGSRRILPLALGVAVLSPDPDHRTQVRVMLSWAMNPQLSLFKRTRRRGAVHSPQRCGTYSLLVIIPSMLSDSVNAIYCVHLIHL